jgi:hypothetical protein
MEIKVQCDCGQRYKFDAEPVGGQMPFAVNCPVCGADGTEKANAVLASVSAAASPPVAPPAGLRMRQPSIGAAASPPAPPAPEITPAHYAARPVDVPRAERDPNLVLGILGALIGGVVGTVIWVFLYKLTGWSLEFLAIGVGVLSGWCGRFLGRSPGTSMGLAAAACALVAIIGAHYMRVEADMIADSEEMQAWYEEWYAEDLEEAKEVVAAVPNGTDQEIRMYLAQRERSYGAKVRPSEITQEDIQFFRDGELAEAHDLVAGKRTRDDYVNEYLELDEEWRESMIGRIVFWVLALGLFNIGSTVLGVGAAYKVGAAEA